MLKPGTIVGDKYRLRHLIADGGMAEVYCGELSVEIGRLYAIKRLLPSLAISPIFAQMFAQEAALAASLKHRNIVACHEFIRDGRDLFMVMELIVGKEVGALLPIIKSRSLMERTQVALLIGQSICEALSYVHDKADEFGIHAGIVHGDISPQNIMISMQGEIKLYDFGAAEKTHGSLILKEDLVRGNLRYMSPEHMTGYKIQAQSDLYSLSLVLLEMIGHDAILAKRSEISLKQARTFDPLNEIAPQYFVNDQIAAIFKMGLAFDIDQRFQSATQMLSALKEAANTLSIHAEDKLLPGLMNQAQTVIPHKNAIRVRFTETTKSLWFITCLIVGFCFFIWLIIVIGVDLFEPKLRHNFPHWTGDAQNIIEIRKPSAVALRMVKIYAEKRSEIYS